MSHEKFGTGNIVSKISKALGGYSDIGKKSIDSHVGYAKSLKGDRRESEKERVIRVAHESETISQERIDATAAKDQALLEHTAASHAESIARIDHATQLEAVASLRAAVAVNPQNAGLQLKLLREERQFLNEENRLQAAEKVTEEARTALEVANERDVIASQATPDSATGSVSEVQRQLNYAAAIEGTANWATLSTNPNTIAAQEIRTNAARNDLQKAVAAITEALKREG
jgi:hypothetical protein